MTEIDSSETTGGLAGTPWDFVVRIEPLGSQPTLGLGILVNERVVLTTGAVLPETGPPFVAVAVVSSTVSVQAEPVQRVASASGDVVVLRLLEPLPPSEATLLSSLSPRKANASRRSVRSTAIGWCCSAVCFASARTRRTSRSTLPTGVPRSPVRPCSWTDPSSAS